MFLKKYTEHTELCGGSVINLHKKPMNCSFDYIGAAKLSEIVEFTMNYGHQATVPSLHGGWTSPRFVGAGDGLDGFGELSG